MTPTDYVDTLIPVGRAHPFRPRRLEGQSIDLRQQVDAIRCHSDLKDKIPVGKAD
jgi:hypothetical protein